MASSDAPTEPANVGRGPTQYQLIGREQQLGRAIEHVRAVGELRLLCIIGEPGIGKTRLAEEITWHARAAHQTVAWGGCWEGDGGVLWPWREIGRQLKGVAGMQEFAASLARAPMDSAATEARLEWLDSLAATLAQAAVAHPLCLVLDDLQWADLPSLLLLELVVRQMAPLMLVLTWRERDAAVHGPLLAQLERIRRRGVTIQLAGLERAEITQFFAQLGHCISHDLAEAVRVATGGNPFFLSEVGRAFRPQSPQIQLTEGVRAYVQRRLESLSPTCREVVESASVAGREFAADRLSAFGIGGGAEAEATLREAVRWGFLVEASSTEACPPGGGDSSGGSRRPTLYRFQHDLTREGVYAGLEAPRRAILHRRWAESLIRSRQGSRNATPIFEHLLLANAASEDIAKWAYVAAEANAAEQNYEVATSIVDRCVPLLSQEPENQPILARLLVLRAKATILSGQAEVGIELCKDAAQLARACGSPLALAEAALAWGLEIRFSRVDAEHVALLEEALATLEPSHEELRIRLKARLAAALQPSREPARAIDLAREALRDARKSGDPSTLAWVLHHARGALRPLDDLEERLAWDVEALSCARVQADPVFELRALGRLGTDALEAGDRAAAEAHWTHFAKLAHRVGRVRYLRAVDQHQALLDTWAGEFEQARARLDQAENKIVPGELVPLIEPVALERLLLARWWGRRSWLEEAFASLVLSPGTEALRGVCCLWLGDRDAAREVYQHIGDAPFPLHYFDLAMRPELCAACGSKEQATALYAGLLGFRRRHVVYLAATAVSDGSFERLLGCLAHRSGQLAAATDHFERALIANQRLDAPQIVAKTREDFAANLADSSDASDRARAFSLWQAALHTFQTLGMSLDAERVRCRMSDCEAALAQRPDARARVPEPQSRGSSPPERGEQLALESEGEFWRIRFEGASLLLRDCDGLRYLALLVGRPRQDLHSLELMAERKGARGVQHPSDVGELSVHPLTMSRIDGQAVRAYRERLVDVKQELDDLKGADGSPRALRLRAECEQLTEELAQSLGLGGKARRGATTAERARINVTQRIRAAIRRIGEQNPRLEHYLNSTIRTGQFCGYHPPPAK